MAGPREIARPRDTVRSPTSATTEKRYANLENIYEVALRSAGVNLDAIVPASEREGEKHAFL